MLRMLIQMLLERLADMPTKKRRDSIPNLLICGRNTRNVFHVIRERLDSSGLTRRKSPFWRFKFVVKFNISVVLGTHCGTRLISLTGAIPLPHVLLSLRPFVSRYRSLELSSKSLIASFSVITGRLGSGIG